MFGKNAVVLLLAIFAASCANPKYAPAVKPGVNQQNVPSSTAAFASGKKVSLVWDVKPTEDDFGSFFFRTFEADARDGFPLLMDLAPELEVVLWMPGMGHGSSPVTVERLGVGTYRATKVFFSMRGDWEIRFKLKNGTTTADEAVVPFSF